MWSNRNSHAYWWEGKNEATTLQNSLAVSYIVKCAFIPYDPTIPFISIYSKKVKLFNKKLYMNVQNGFIHVYSKLETT